MKRPVPGATVTDSEDGLTILIDGLHSLVVLQVPMTGSTKAAAFADRVKESA